MHKSVCVFTLCLWIYDDTQMNFADINLSLCIPLLLTAVCEDRVGVMVINPVLHWQSVKRAPLYIPIYDLRLCSSCPLVHCIREHWCDLSVVYDTLLNYLRINIVFLFFILLATHIGCYFSNTLRGLFECACTVILISHVSQCEAVITTYLSVEQTVMWAKFNASWFNLIKM